MLTNQLVEKFNISPSSPSPPSLFIILSVLCHHFPSVVFYKSGFSQESRSSRCCVLGTEHTAGCRADTGIGRAGGGLLRDPVNRGCRHRPLPATAKRCAARELAGKLLSFLGVPGKSHQYLICSSGAGAVQEFPAKFLQISHLPTLGSSLQRIMAFSLPTSTSHKIALSLVKSNLEPDGEKNSGKCNF